MAVRSATILAAGINRFTRTDVINRP